MVQLFMSSLFVQQLLFHLLVVEVATFSQPHFSSPSERDGHITSTHALEQFPSKSTSPKEVLTAQLGALQATDMENVFTLFSRARRLVLEDLSRRDFRESTVPPSRVHPNLVKMLNSDCPGLVGHRSSIVLSVIGDPKPPKGRLRTRLCRVQVDRSRYFVFTMTRQSPFDGGDPRDNDGYEKCWFVSKIAPEGKDGGSEDDDIPMPGGPQEERRVQELVFS